jgi:RNA polymerase sigma factor (sigma-70 family)
MHPADPTTALFVRYRQHGDLDALGRVFDALAPRLLSLAMHACGHAADAEDLLQATFVVAIRKAAAFDVATPVGAWLAGVLAGEAKNLTRREGRRRMASLGDAVAVDGDGDPVAAGERADLVAALRTHVEALPAEQRQVLLLQLEHGLAPAAIAEVLGVPPGTVRMRLHRGIAALRGVLPAGLAAVFAMLLPERGLAAVRVAVLREGAAVVGATAVVGAGVAVVAGGMAMKKWLLAALVLVFVGIGWSLALHGSEVERAPDRAPAQPEYGVLANTLPPGDAPSTAGAAREEIEPVASALPSSSGSLRVVARGVVGQRVDRRTWVSSSVGGTALADVLVEAWQGPEDPDTFGVGVTKARTDAHGLATIDVLSPGVWRVAVSSGGKRCGTKVATVTLGATTDVEFHLGMHDLRGRVVDADGAPVANATIWAGRRSSRAADADRQLRGAVTSAPDGRFACAVIQGEEAICARKPGYAASWSHPIDQVGDGEVVLRLGRAPGSIAATVRVPPGVPMPPLSVQAQSTREDGGRDRDGALRAPPLAQVAEAAPPDTFVVRDLVPGVYEVLARWPGRVARKAVNVLPGETAAVEFAIAPGALVRGTVRDGNGRPRVGVHVMLSRAADGDRTVLTDAGGVFQFAGVEPGPAKLAAARIVSGARGEVQVYVPPQGECVADMELVEAQPMHIGLADVAGHGVGSFAILARQGGREFAAVHEGCGKFAIWGLTADAARVEVRMLDRFGKPVGEPVLVHDLASVDVATHLELVVPEWATARGCIVGRLIDEHGRAVARAFVEVEGELPTFFTNVDEQGRFRLENVAPGRRTVQVEADGHVKRNIDIDVRADVPTQLGDVVLVRAGELRLQFLRTDGTAWREYPPSPMLRCPDGTWRTSGFEVVDGAVFARDLAPGRYTVQTRFDDELRFEPQAVDVRAGATARSTIAVELGRRVLAFVTPPPGLTLGTATVTALDAAGRVVATAAVKPDGGERWCAALVLPFGPCTLHLTSSTGITHEQPFVVSPELGSRDRVRLELKAPK